MSLSDFFGPDGPLAVGLDGYSLRPGQLEMAEAVAKTLSEGGTLLAEAGTGTGKTLAYLAPAVLSGKKVVVSTATKTLQSQVLEKEVPLLARALGRPVSAALLKGRQNYLCLRRFERFRLQPLFRFAAESRLYVLLERWAGSTGTGDRAELLDVPEDFGPWREVCSTTETCWGGRCPREADCHFLQHRRAAQKAQVVVVNHHLFFADLAVRASTSAEVIPRYAAAILDEAHHLEAVATQYFGVRVSSYRVAELVRDSAQLPAAAKGERDAAASAAEEADALWRALPRAANPLRLSGALQTDAAQALAALREALNHWSDHLAPRQGENQEAECLFRRLEELRRDLAVFAAPLKPGEVRWVEGRGRGVFLHAAPVEVGPLLEKTLFDGRTPVVLTSATLRVGGSFAYARDRLGLRDAQEVVVESPFDYRSRSLLYVPQALPEPNAAGFADSAAAEIRRLLASTHGRAFCLFTSHRVLQSVAAALRGTLPYRLLVQGETPREELLRCFREDVHSVLLGAQVFWEGVDVPGEALSAVIIDRLPFATPSDPLVEARIEAVRARGESPFWAYQVPAAAMALRQGVGRLLRRIDDRGVVAVLDRRLLESSYAAFLRRSLPPFPVTRDPRRVQSFFEGPEAP